MRPLRLLLFLLPLAAASPTQAAAPNLFALSARSLALGGAVRATATTIDAARVNPAAVGPQRGFFAGVSYMTRREEPVDAVAITMVDNITSPMGGALQYLRLQGTEEREDLSLSLSMGKRGLWWGFTVRYVHGRDRGETTWHDVVNGDLGVLVERPNGLRIAVVGYDLLETTVVALERRIALGVAKEGLWGWTVEADIVRNLERDFGDGLDLHLGAEYPFADWPLALRLGQQWRGDTGNDAFSAGLGLTWDRWQVEYGVQRTRQDPGDMLHALSASASF